MNQQGIKARELLKEVCDYNDGKGKYNFSQLQDYERANESFDAWMDLRNRIDNYLAELKQQIKTT